MQISEVELKRKMWMQSNTKISASNKLQDKLQLMWLKRSSEHWGRVQSTASRLTRPHTPLDETSQATHITSNIHHTRQTRHSTGWNLTSNIHHTHQIRHSTGWNLTSNIHHTHQTRHFTGWNLTSNIHNTAHRSTAKNCRINSVETDTLVTMLCSPTGGGVILLASVKL